MYTQFLRRKKFRVILSLFPSCLNPFYKSEAWCSTIQMKMSLTCMRMKSLSYERMGTKTRFGEEAKGNSEMPYWMRSDCLTMKSKWLQKLGSFIHPRYYGHWPYLEIFACNISKSRRTLTLFGAMFQRYICAQCFGQKTQKLLSTFYMMEKIKILARIFLEWTHFDIVWRKVLEIIELDALDSRHMLKLLSAILDIVDNVKIVARIYQREGTG